jgi:hypothetical protein
VLFPACRVFASTDGFTVIVFVLPSGAIKGTLAVTSLEVMLSPTLNFLSETETLMSSGFPTS